MTDIIHSLPPGFRFHPTDVELMHYLKNKVSSSLCNSQANSIIAEIDLYKLNPWELPEKAYFGESEWFCFSPRDRKYPNSDRPNRTTASGYWKATGTDKPIFSSQESHNECVGVKKSLIFYKGRAPKGTKTSWIMNEYRLPTNNITGQFSIRGSMRLDDWVLCRVCHKQAITEIKKPETAGNLGIAHENIDHQFQKIEFSSPESEVLDGTKAQHDLIQERIAEPSVLYRNSDFYKKKKNMKRSLKEALENIKRVLSLEALDEQAQEFSSNNKRICFLSRSNCSSNSSAINFQISSA